MKKPRTQKQCYPGGHIEVWHKSSEVFQPQETLCGTSVQEKATTEHNPAQQLQHHTSLIPDRGLSTTQETNESAIVPFYNDQVSYEANYSRQWLQHEPVTSQFVQDQLCSFQSVPSADLSLLTCDSAPSTTFLSTSHEKWAGICSETLSSPETWVDSNLEARLLPGTQPFAYSEQTQGVGLYNNWFTQTYEDPFNFSGLTQPDFCYFPWTVSNNLTMGGGDHFPTSYQTALVSKPEEDCAQLSLHNSWPTQQTGFTPKPSDPLWTDAEIPAQPVLQDGLPNCTSPPLPVEQTGLCLYGDSHEEQMSHESPSSLVSRPQQSPQIQETDVADGDEKEVLTASEDSQDTAQQCTCETQSPDATCSSCVNNPQSWVLVTYKLLRPSEVPKKQPKPRRRLEEHARRQTSQTRESGACVRCKIQRVRCIPNDEDPSGPCEGCCRVALNHSKKVLHHIGCVSTPSLLSRISFFHVLKSSRM